MPLQACAERLDPFGTTMRQPFTASDATTATAWRVPVLAALRRVLTCLATVVISAWPLRTDSISSAVPLAQMVLASLTVDLLMPTIAAISACVLAAGQPAATFVLVCPF